MKRWSENLGMGMWVGSVWFRLLPGVLWFLVVLSPGMFAAESNLEVPENLEPFFQALTEKNPEGALEMLQGRDPKDWGDQPLPMNNRMEKGWRPLHHAAYFGNADLCLQIIRYGGGVNRTDSFGNTPMHIAARYGHAVCIAALALKGGTIDCRNSDGKTPLHLAVEADMGDAVKALIRLGANRRILDNEGKASEELADVDETRRALTVPALQGKKDTKSALIILWERVKEDGRWYMSDREAIDEMLTEEKLPATLKYKKLLQMMQARGIPEPR